MTTLSLSATRSRGVLLAGVVGFAVALALASQVSVPLLVTPVPLTLQPMLVVLAGLWLGPRAAAASMALYLVTGALGAPVFTPGGLPGPARLLGPTGGYLLAYPLAAAATGWLALRADGLMARIGAAAVGMLVIYAGGLAQLAVITGSLQQAALLGALPFAALDAAKAVAAALLAPARSTPRALS
jgi:biotin transport system substrate-specific component